MRVEKRRRNQYRFFEELDRTFDLALLFLFESFFVILNRFLRKVFFHLADINYIRVGGIETSRPFANLDGRFVEHYRDTRRPE